MKRYRSYRSSSLSRRFGRGRLGRRARLSATAVTAIGALAIIALVGWFLGRRGAGDDAGALLAYARASAVQPAALVVEGARTHGIVVLGDLVGSATAKRIAAAALEPLALGPGLDVLVLGVDTAAQPFIDAYLDGSPEDVSPLLTHPEALPDGDERDGLGIYRRVWQLNRQLGADRAISILAAGGSLARGSGQQGPREAAEWYAGLGAAMAARIERQVFARDPRARILVFVDGYQALRSGWGLLAAGGGRPVRVQWLAAVLAADHTGDVFSVLPDGPAPPGPVLDTRYAGTRAFTLLDGAAGLRPPFGLPLGPAFAFLTSPLLPGSPPGTELAIEPQDYRLGDVADGYIDLGSR